MRQWARLDWVWSVTGGSKVHEGLIWHAQPSVRVGLNLTGQLQNSSRPLANAILAERAISHSVAAPGYPGPGEPAFNVAPRAAVREREGGLWPQGTRPRGEPEARAMDLRSP
jgi:hypothetical protein